jgi:hypothetical protein
MWLPFLEKYDEMWTKEMEEEWKEMSTMKLSDLF